jgi:hypothetical protein
MIKKFCYFIVAILLTGCDTDQSDKTIACREFLTERSNAIYHNQESFIPAIDSGIHKYCDCESIKVHRLP